MKKKIKKVIVIFLVVLIVFAVVVRTFRYQIADYFSEPQQAISSMKGEFVSREELEMSRNVEPIELGRAISTDEMESKIADIVDATSEEEVAQMAGDYKKVIKDATIAVEVEDVEGMYQKIMGLVLELGGEEFYKSFITGYNEMMELELKFPPEKLEVFETKLTNLVGEGKIESSSINSRDITAEYYDIEARLDSYKASRDQLLKIMQMAETVEETLKVQSELTKIQAEIESMQGKINMLNKLVDMATVNLNIHKIRDPLKNTGTIDWKFSSKEDIWRTMQYGFISVVNVIYNSIVWLVIIIVSAIPIIIPVALVVWIVVYRRKNQNISSSDDDSVEEKDKEEKDKEEKDKE